RPPVQDPSPVKRSIAGRNRSAGPEISGAALPPRSARTGKPQPIFVQPRVPDYSEDNTSYPIVPSPVCPPLALTILSPTRSRWRKYVEGFRQAPANQGLL